MAERDDTSAVAQRFFDAIERGDIAAVRDCFAPDAAIWHNDDEQVISVDQTIAILRGMIDRIAQVRYADRRVHAFAGGFVQQHVLEGRRVHDDVDVRMPCCIVCAVADGRITRLDEYFDSAHVNTFRKFSNS